MTVLLLTIASIAFVLLVFTAAADLLFGPDHDLDGPWQPGDRPRWRP